MRTSTEYEKTAVGIVKVICELIARPSLKISLSAEINVAISSDFFHLWQRDLFDVFINDIYFCYQGKVLEAIKMVMFRIYLNRSSKFPYVHTRKIVIISLTFTLISSLSFFIF